MGDYVAAGQTGVLVAPGDVEAFADTMAALLQDRDRLVAFGHAARCKLETDSFTWKGLSDRIGAVILSAA